jgi:hypothetical protein
MKKLLLLACLIGSSAAQAENTGFSLGLGKPYGGLGMKFAVGDASTKYFGGIGYQPTVDTEDKLSGGLGFALGFEHVIINEHHTIGASLATIKNTKIYNQNYRTLGLAANYAYHFSGYNQKSWVLGADVFAGKENLPAYYRDNTIYGIGLMVGYNF